MDFSICNERLQLDCSATGLSLTERPSGKRIFTGTKAGLAAYGKQHRDLWTADDFSARIDSPANDLLLSGTIDALQVKLRYTLEDGSQSLKIAMRLRNLAGTPFQLGDVSPLCLDRDTGASGHLLAEKMQLFTLGRMMVDSSLLGSREKGNLRTFAIELGGEKQHYHSEYILATHLDHPGDLTEELTLAFDHIGIVSCGFCVDLEQGVSYARAAYRGAVLPAGGELQLPTLSVDGISPASQALERAAATIAEIYQPPVPARVHSGWCSWYYYYANVAESDILQNLQYIASHRERFPYDVVQIDDGYQQHWGDWLLPGKKFPHDMAYLAEEIKALGFRPGIWVAPMIMTAQSDLFKNHPDWAVKRFEDNEALSQQGWSPPDENPWIILDGTHPDFLQYIKEVFTVMAHDWGYEYFKLDALSHGAYAGLRHDPARNGDQALRGVIETIREAIGPDKYLLGCTAPFGSVIGLVNGERVSGDVSTAFLSADNGCSLEANLPQSIHRSFVHGKWWHNDPDCVLVRSQGTPHNQSLSKKGLSLDEARLFVTVIGMTQGIQMVGENMMELEEERMVLLDTIQPLMPAPAKPLDLFSPQPRYLHLKTPRGHIVAVINWEHAPVTERVTWQMLGLNAGDAFTAYELWTDRYLGVVTDHGLDLTVPAHGCCVVLLRKHLVQPQLVGFSGHLSCGSALIDEEQWDDANDTYTLTICANRAGTLRLFIPENRRINDHAFSQCEDGSWRTNLPRGRTSLILKLTPTS